MQQVIAITGASGAIGRALVKELAGNDDFHVRVFSRNQQRDLSDKNFPTNVTIVEGDLYDSTSIRRLLESNCVVIHLAYLWDAGETENLVVTNNLLEACRDIGIKRLIHCSTAAVVGRVLEDKITELTVCQPVTEYGITKLKIEEEIVKAASSDFFDVVIVRPTAVFGREGEQLRKLADDLRTGNVWLNYAKSCLFGKRKMNLVHITNVVAALVFFIRMDNSCAGNIFIVSDDDEPKNNFSDVEQFLMTSLDIRGYPLPKVTLPKWILSTLLAIRGRNNVNPLCEYDSSKLLRLGFKRPVSLEVGLAEYAQAYQAAHLSPDESKTQ